ncbi:protein DpdE [Kitasatospora sp. NPDC085879]|uniref:protein DpdE n=1 Tax=Kitasatospora sp. NPDC085879 TaxID=3154769 RepID=UPI0034155CD1
MASEFAVGSLVEFPGSPGIGRVRNVSGDVVHVDFFESVADPSVEGRDVPIGECRRVSLEPQTRVFRCNPSTGEWLAGRIAGVAPGLRRYFVHFPNTDYDLPVPEEDLYVRWNRPVADPLQVLVSGGNESGYLYNARIPMLRSIIEQRAVSANTPALLAAAAEIYPHQVRAASIVLADPVQRYLLADEVGLGKTIEAGYVIMQTLIDNPQATVVIVAPDSLRRQWNKELQTKFFVGDFSGRLTITSHESPEKWKNYCGSDLVVIDEAHILVQDRDDLDATYQSLCVLAHSASKLLLLSATPVTSNYATYLGFLHLLDPDVYKWSEREAFEQQYQRRAELASHLYSLDAEFCALLPSSIDLIRKVLPREDTRFDVLADRVLELLDDQGELVDESSMPDLSVAVAALRAHISETYRLHRRVIRHRRANVLNGNDDSASGLYEVRGRTEPEALTIDSYDPAADSLMQWQARVWGHLLDQGCEEELRETYALVLAVLASRLGGSAEDFIDAFRRRVRGDDDAAQRACLSTREERYLDAAAVLPFEAELLEELESQIVEAYHAAELGELVDAIVPAFRAGTSVIVFCGPGSLASKLTKRLSSRFPRKLFLEHTRHVGGVASERAIAQWRGADGRHAVLIADDTAEDGLNLQTADVVVHLRLPWSPNQLEQRLGRTDRYVESHRQRQPPAQFVLTDPEALSGAWLSLLSRGYEVFTGSVSTLQDAIAQGLARTWAEALEYGPEGLTDNADAVRAGMSEARAEIDQMDMLESVFDSSPEGDQAEVLGEFEADWRGIREAMLDFTGRDGSDGIKVRHFRPSSDCDSFEITSRTLVSPHLFDRNRPSDKTMKGTFNRNVALSSPGTRLFRIGHPLVDTLAKVVWWDDRGQATAFWRADPGHKGEPEPYFGFDYLVEADTASALDLALKVPHAQKRVETEAALRRQADQLLPPFTLKVWVPAGAAEAVTDQAVRTWLDQPYRATDHNFNFKRIQELLDFFDGRAGYEAAVRSAERVGREELERVTNLAERCAEAQESGRERLTVARAQAEARQAAGRLLGDGESYLLDVGVTAALVQALSHPAVRLVSATCVLKTGLRRVTRGD